MSESWWRRLKATRIVISVVSGLATEIVFILAVVSPDLPDGALAILLNVAIVSIDFSVVRVNLLI
jgi:hypothetical protein